MGDNLNIFEKEDDLNLLKMEYNPKFFKWKKTLGLEDEQFLGKGKTTDLFL
jgi:hypothetical protein